jgi:hypothetical protein
MAIRQPARLAHAFFHPEADVRRAALAPPIPVGTSAMAFLLFADDACRDVTDPHESRVDERRMGEPVLQDL